MGRCGRHLDCTGTYLGGARRKDFSRSPLRERVKRLEYPLVDAPRLAEHLALDGHPGLEGVRQTIGRYGLGRQLDDDAVRGLDGPPFSCFGGDGEPRDPRDDAAMVAELLKRKGRILEQDLVARLEEAYGARRRL